MNFQGSLNKHNEEDREQELWVSLCEGKRIGLDGLFRKYYSSLFNYGLNILSNEEAVKDAIQELFLKLWKKHNSLTKPDSISAYLLVSLRRILFSMIKKDKNRVERNLAYLQDDFSISFTKEELISKNELEKEKKVLLVEAIKHLSGIQKETIFLRYYHGLTNKEIAKIMNINHQSVKNNLYRALKNLRGIIDFVPN